MSKNFKKLAEYGSWYSKITSKYLTQGNFKAICELQVFNGNPFWIEQTFPNGTRVLFEQQNNQNIIQWSPDNVSVSNTVHEYGGGSFCVNDLGVFISTKTGIYQLTEPKKMRTIYENSNNVDKRYADLFIFKNFIFAVEERHDLNNKNKEPVNSLVRIDCTLNEVKVIADGADFYAAPRVSLNGEYLVWMQWNKPNMPWDKTSIWLVELTKNCLFVNEPRKLLSDACYYGPQWAQIDNKPELFINGDPTNFWNIYNVDLNEGGLKKNMCPLQVDMGSPLWQLADDRAYAISNTDLVISIGHTNPVLYHKSLNSLNTEFNIINTLKEAGFTVFSFLTLSKTSSNVNDNSNYNHRTLFTLASGPMRTLSLIKVNLENYEVTIIRETRSTTELKTLDLSQPQLHTFSSNGDNVDGYFYPPYNSLYQSLQEDNLPPVVFFCHPGPTTQTTDSLDLKKQYFTTRGFAVFDINYRGSTGYGTEFRNKLYKNWGIVDAEDMINGAKYLIKKKMVNPKQVCIIGSSAGGYLVFSTLSHPEKLFAAGVSIYGVTDLLDLCKCTHKFESKYNDQLVALYPEEIEIYKKRSPVNNLNKINTPVAFLHGSRDPVVPCSQSILFFEELRKKGIPTAIHIFEGESHGFKTIEAITKSVDMTYTFFCRILKIKPSINCEIEIYNLPEDE